MADDWVTTDEAARLTGYTSSYFRKAIKRGLLHAKKHGRDWVLSKREVRAYAARMKRLGRKKHNPHGTRDIG